MIYYYLLFIILNANLCELTFVGLIDLTIYIAHTYCWWVWPMNDQTSFIGTNEFGVYYCVGYSFSITPN